MPFILILIGILMVVVGIRNTQGDLGTLLVGDFTGMPNFFYWVVAIFIIGALGYVEELQAPSDAMLMLILLAIILSNRGFFANFTAQLQSGSAAPPPPGPANPQPVGASGGSSSGGGGSSGGGIQPVAQLAAVVGHFL